MGKIAIVLVLLIFFAPSALSALPPVKDYCQEIYYVDERFSSGLSEWLDCDNNVEHSFFLDPVYLQDTARYDNHQLGNDVCENYRICYNDPVALRELNDLVEISKISRSCTNCLKACEIRDGGVWLYETPCTKLCVCEYDSNTYLDPMDDLGPSCAYSLIAAECCPESSNILSGCGTSSPVASVEVCDNLVDDDGDSLVDCADSDCAVEPSCAFKVSGSVVTGGNKPLAKVMVALMDRSNNKIVVGYTDDYGAFTLDYSSKAAALGLPAQSAAAYLRIYLEDEDGLFEIVWDLQSANSEYTIDTQYFPIPTDQRFDIILKSGIDLLAEDNKVTGKGWDSHWDAGNAYYETKRFFDFAHTKLGYGFNGGGNYLPIKVYIYTSESDTSAFYSSATRGGGIFLPPWKTSHENTMCPENCLWHELFHFTMYNKYSSWPPDGPIYENHAGFKNSNTADSYTESFAEFWPNILALELNGDAAHIYAGVWNMELNYNPWVSEGEDEEFALATLFWDMYDSNQDKGESMSVPYKDLWDVFMSKRLDNAKEVYDAINAKWPDKQAEIDSLFVAHGIFKDANPGNGQYDQGEPYWDDNPSNGVHDPNEDYIDIGTPDDGISRPHQVYTPGEEIGTATNYARATRKNKPLEEESFARVDVTSNGAAVNDAVFKVSYSFSDPSLDYVSYGVVDEQTGYVYVEMPPDEYQVTAAITADNYDGGQPVTVTADDYYASKAEGAGVIKSAGISAGGRKADYCNNDRTCQTGESQNCGDCWSTSPAGGGASAPGDSSAIGVILIVVIVIGAAAFIFVKKRKPVAKSVKQITVKSEFCQMCGTAVPPESAFCQSCGRKV